MARPKPLDPPALASLKPPREPFLSVEIHVVTPMFGGGAEAGVPDTEFPIHGAAVRGHLRFWWRACFGSRYATAAEMFADEAGLWGRAHRSSDDFKGPGDKRPPSERRSPSAVEVVVAILDAGTAQPVAEFVNDPSRPGRLSRKWTLRVPPYVVFPFQGETARVRGSERVSKVPADAVTGVRFQLQLTLGTGVTTGEDRAALESEATAAAWAWVTFGGIGARTRRGCGSLFSEKFKPDVPLSDWLVREAASRCAAGQSRPQNPLLSGATVVCPSTNRATTGAQPEQAWSDAARLLQEFRQGVPYARNPGRQSNRPGRSLWPEPDSVRELLGLPDSQHRPAHEARPFFPRADLGLPLLFQQMAGRDTPTLQAAEPDATRFASPVIVKALALSVDRAVPALLVFNTPHVWELAGQGLHLRGAGQDRTVAGSVLHDTGKAGKVRPLHENNGTIARQALIGFARRRWTGAEVVTL
jgi:CRISPR-associated protein Cmr1